MARGQRFERLFRHEKTSTLADACFFGGDKRDRTADLLNAIQALSQLSYTPVFSCVSAADLLNIADFLPIVNP